MFQIQILWEDLLLLGNIGHYCTFTSQIPYHILMTNERQMYKLRSWATSTAELWLAGGWVSRCRYLRCPSPREPPSVIQTLEQQHDISDCTPQRQLQPWLIPLAFNERKKGTNNRAPKKCSKSQVFHISQRSLSNRAGIDLLHVAVLCCTQAWWILCA